MIFVDTNYFLRYFLQDIPDQYRRAHKLFLSAARGEQDLCTSVIVFFEIYWVLASVYAFDRAKIAAVLNKVLDIHNLTITEEDILQAALILYLRHKSLNLEDCYNMTYARVRDVAEFATFDKKLAKAFAR